MISRNNTLLMTAIAMLAFAGNSILCRLALSDDSSSAESFTLVRLLSGAITLTLLTYRPDQQLKALFSGGEWLSGFYLFAYAAAFSFAYAFLDTATGALILFASVQLTILCVSILSGEALNKRKLIGVVLSVSGFVLLMLPSSTQPSLFGFVLMTASGLAWAAYTLAGRNSDSPLIDTQGNFLKATVFALVAFIWFVDINSLTLREVVLASASGALASGCGYAIWYAALKGLTRLSAGIVQLTVPVIAAFGGIIFVGEAMTLAFVIASLLVLSGVGLVVYQSSKTV